MIKLSRESLRNNPKTSLSCILSHKKRFSAVPDCFFCRPSETPQSEGKREKARQQQPWGGPCNPPKWPSLKKKALTDAGKTNDDAIMPRQEGGKEGPRRRIKGHLHVVQVLIASKISSRNGGNLAESTQKAEILAVYFANQRVCSCFRKAIATFQQVNVIFFSLGNLLSHVNVP